MKKEERDIKELTEEVQPSNCYNIERLERAGQERVAAREELALLLSSTTINNTK